MDVAELARREHDNMLAADMLAVSQMPGSVAERGNGLAVLATGLPLRTFNQVLIDGHGAPDGPMSAAVSVMRERAPGRFSVTLRRDIDDAWIPVVTALGLVRVSDQVWMPGMAFHPIPAGTDTPAHAEIDIREVADAEGTAAHIHAAAAGFGIPAEWLQPLITVDFLGHPDVRLYVGYHEEDSVVAGLGVRVDTTIGVYNIATVPDARRRGYGTAMTQRIIDDGARDGCDVAVLQASEAGKPVYERMGFRTVVEYDAYSDPPDPT
jgi:ribosomal protein S18 acetylase RimI-like enzyme